MKVRELSKLLDWYIELGLDDFDVHCFAFSGKPQMTTLRGVAVSDDPNTGTFDCLRPEVDEDNATTYLDRKEWDMCAACALRSSVVDGPSALWLVASEDFPYPPHWERGPFSQHTGPLLWTASGGQSES
jgi:hypothetical protein